MIRSNVAAPNADGESPGALMNEICEILIRINQLEFEQGEKNKVKIGPSRLPASTKRLKTSAFTVSSC